jgi:hypothetical protein
LNSIFIGHGTNEETNFRRTFLIKTIAQFELFISIVLKNYDCYYMIKLLKQFYFYYYYYIDMLTII